MKPNKVGRPKTNEEKMSSIRVRESQRVIFNAMKRESNDPHHKILGRVLKFYFKHHPKRKKQIREILTG